MTDREILNSGRRRQLRIVRCPHCAIKWIAPGVRGGDSHVCKECGLSFVVKTAEREIQPTASGDQSGKLAH